MDEEKRYGKIAEFFKTERVKLVRYVRRMIDDAADQDGEDIVQDVMLNLFNMADVTLPVENLAAYIYRALRNRVVDMLKKRRLEEVSLDADRGGLLLKEVLYDNRYDTASESERNYLKDELYRTIDTLNVEDKAIIILTEFEGRTYKEISNEWDVPIGTLLSRKSRAMDKIKDKLIHLEQSGGTR
jgi:RNA polymerase sigma factor (sigma-70 family)